VFSIIGQTLRIAAARWPLILAWYLAGWLARYAAIEVAAFFGATSTVLGFLILPLAVLARLGSFIAIFLVVRGSMPAFTDMRGRGDTDVEVTGGAPVPRQRATDLFLVSIVPFFAFYAAWKFLQDDIDAYARAALAKIDFFTADDTSGSVTSLEFGPITVAIVVVAFVGRFVLKRYADKLPRWISLVSVYLEAVWVYFTVFFVSFATGDTIAWIQNRAVVHALIDFKDDALAAVAWIVDAAVWLFTETSGIVLLPIAWLTLAGVVYGRALAAPKISYRPKIRVYEKATERIAALPSGVSTRIKDVGLDLVERVSPITNALALIWRAGVVPMGIFVLAYTVLDVASEWLFRAAVLVIGPHDLGSWWMNVDDILSFAIVAVIEPLQLCLIAAAYDYCLRKLEERRDARLEVEPEVVG
jgi:hypothetical protein